MSEPFAQQADPETLFMTLADESRLKILQALWESDTGAASFSELHDAVGIRDSGQFNYHLDKLMGSFVTKTDGGYELTQAGKYVNGAIESGVYTGRGEITLIELDGSCRVCGGVQTLQYEDEVVRITCTSCSAGWSVPVPPAVLAGYDRADIPGVVSDLFWTRFFRISNGFCAYCYGQMHPTVGPISEMDIGPSVSEDPSEAAEPQSPEFPVVQFTCDRCGARAGLGLDHALLLVHPAVIHFYYEHGINVWDHLIWNLDFNPEETTIESRDPIRARVTFRVDDNTLILTVDESFTVTEIAP